MLKLHVLFVKFRILHQANHYFNIFGRSRQHLRMICPLNQTPKFTMPFKIALTVLVSTFIIGSIQASTKLPPDCDTLVLKDGKILLVNIIALNKSIVQFKHCNGRDTSFTFEVEYQNVARIATLKSKFNSKSTVVLDNMQGNDLWSTLNAKNHSHTQEDITIPDTTQNERIVFKPDVNCDLMFFKKTQKEFEVKLIKEDLVNYYFTFCNESDKIHAVPIKDVDFSYRYRAGNQDPWREIKLGLYAVLISAGIIAGIILVAAGLSFF